ncbi:MAG TPA: hypothetical protein VGS19_24795 [Streptosporangiaceae bacterium]|nr:hypothetical protein [Streptosporangiaceae bacterium]
MRGHPDPDTLAAFREQLLHRRRAARVAAHLSGCPRCAAADAGLAQVSTLLASVTMPPMPAELTTRIESALAAEAATRAAQPTPQTAVGAPQATAPQPAVPNGTRTHQRRQTPRPSRPWTGVVLRVAAATAAVAVAAGGGYGLVRLLSNGTSASYAPSGAVNAKSDHAIEGQGNSPAAPAGSALGAMALGYQVVASHTDYQPRELAAQVNTLLADHSVPHGMHAPVPARTRQPGWTNGPVPATQQMSGASARLNTCVVAATGGRRPRIVDTAHYRGQPATVIVMPATATGTQVIVVGAGCSAGNPDVLTRLSLR